MGNAAQCTHGTGQNDHHIEGIGAAGEGHIHALGGVELHALGEAQAVRQLFFEDDFRVTTGNDVHLVLSRI